MTVIPGVRLAFEDKLFDCSITDESPIVSCSVA